jgi:hypothetical protein
MATTLRIRRSLNMGIWAESIFSKLASNFEEPQEGGGVTVEGKN